MGRIKSLNLMTGLLLFPVILFAQFNNNTTSPYSRFGLGDLQPYSFGRTSAMGGASLASRYKQQINVSNPASYTAVDSLAFMFEFGINGKITKFSNDISSMKANDANFNYFALNFQITNWLASSVGLLPYSDIGYNLEVNEEIENAGNALIKYYGDGSLSKAYIGFAIDPIKNLSVGFNVNYLFGKLNKKAESYFLSGPYFYNNLKNESIRLRDFNVNLGLQATVPLKKDKHLVLAAILENKPKYTGFSSNLTNKYIAIKVNNKTISDSDTILGQPEEKSTIKFPLTYGFGVSYVKDNIFEINADYYHQQWSKAKFPGETSKFLTDLNKFAIGGEWIPDKFSIQSYLKRVAYRAGIKYENSYLKFGDQRINDFGITFGIGLPVYRSLSTINLSAEFGKRGTKKNNLVLENYGKINLSVNLYDLWFIKRRFD